MILDNQRFAGRNVGSMPAQLAVCQSCLLGFRSPQPSKSELADLYESGSETAWSEGSEVIRKDWELAAQWVERIGASRVLDIGCFDGGFLEMLPATILKAGVEINPAASQRAAERGVQLVASDFHDLDVVAETFDLVSAFDVIEHVHNPKAFLETLSAVVRPRGLRPFCDRQPGFTHVARPQESISLFVVLGTHRVRQPEVGQSTCAESWL